MMLACQGVTQARRRAGRVATATCTRHRSATRSRTFAAAGTNLDHLKAEGDINLSQRRTSYAERNISAATQAVL